MKTLSLTTTLRIRLVVVLSLVLCGGVASVAHGTTFYVDAASGNDSTGTGATGSPWRTIQKCATTAGANNTCLIRSGTYRETVTPNANGMTFAPDTGATVTVSGADLVTGWTVHSGNIYKSTGMTWTLGTGDNQVFVDGQAMNLARFPNASLDLSHPTWLTADSSLPDVQVEGEYNPWVIYDSALTQSNGFWNGAEVTLLAAGMYSEAGTVTSYVTGQLSFTQLHDGQQRPMECPCGQQYKYYLSNVLGALDTAGEWYWDGTTLYLWTPNSDSPAGHTVESKRRQFAFDLRGRSNTTVQNLKIFAASVDMDTSSSGNMLDGIQVTYVWHQLRNIPNRNGTVGTWGQFDAKWGGWNTGIRLAGSNNTLKNCTIAYSSHNGVYLRGTHQVVDNCTIHDVAYVHTEGGAVSWMGDDPTGASPACQDHVVSNSTLYNSGRHIVNFYYCPNITMTHNVMYNSCIDVGDCGIIYQSKGGASGRIDHNIMHTNLADYWTFGIYLDADPENYTLDHNVLYDQLGTYFNVGGDGNGDGVGALNVNVYNNTVWGGSLYLYNGSSNTKLYNNLVQNGMDGSSAADFQNNMSGGSSSMFVNAGAGNFQLASGAPSPPVNSGRTITGITTGAVGTPDIGAYELGATPWTAGATGGSTTPSITITSPACTPTCTVESSPLTTLAGTASAVSPATVSSVTWTCSTCSPTSGTATGTTSWSVASIGLASGVNSITVTVTDSTSATANTSIAVTLTVGGSGPPYLSGPLIWWRGVAGMTGSGRWLDLAPGRNHLTLTNMGFGSTSGWNPSTRLSGRLHLTCDGVDDVLVGSTSMAADLSQKTILAWVYLTSYGGGGLGRILDKRDVTGWTWLANNFNVTNGLSFTQNFSTSNGSWALTNRMTLNTWLHLGISYDRTSTSNVPTFYLNGEALAPDTTLSSPSGTADSDASSTLRMCDDGSAARNLGASLDDVLIFQRLLTPVEVRTVYQLGRLGLPAAPSTPPSAIVSGLVTPPPGIPGAFFPFFQ